MGVDWIEARNGKARFIGPTRGVDELGHDAFEIALAFQPSYFGEYRPKLIESDKFDVEIVSFGFSTKSNVGNNHHNARHEFSASERSTIQEIAELLFRSPDALSGIAMFSSTKAKFSGRIGFSPGWIRER